MASFLEEVSLGFDAAKQTLFNIAKKVYPKIEDSRSTLVNAIFSGIAYLYSMFQVFAKLLQDEVYVETSREIESLYKLIPFVGVSLDQPTTLKIGCSTVPQDTAITNDTTPELYLTGTDEFTDGDGNKFYIRTKAYTNKVLYTFDKDFLVTNNGRTIELSIPKLLGSDYYPVSFYDGENFVVQLPYKCGVNGNIRVAKLTFDITTIDGAADPILTGSTNSSDIVGASCEFNHRIGYLKVLLANNTFQNTFNDSDLDDQPVNITYISRSVYRKDIEETSDAASSYSAGFNTVYNNDNIFDNASENADATSEVVTTTVNKARTLGLLLKKSINPTTLKINHSTISDIEFDFSSAEELTDVFWGTIYKASVTYDDDKSGTYYAYILDKDIGAIYFEDPEAEDNDILADVSNYTLDYTDILNSKILLEQYEQKIQSVRPPSEFDFDSMTYILEDDDMILFEDLVLSIADTGYTGVVYEETTNIVNVTSNLTTAYFEVIVESPTKLKLKFDEGIDYTGIENLIITYNVVKDLKTYDSGSSLSGTTILEERDSTSYTYNGASVFNFDGTNLTGQAGVAGVPTIESLRNTLEKGAYTYDKYITQVNYEYAIQNYFINQGYDALVKVFEYEDFGTTFLDSVNGNIVFFVGLLNKLPNSNLTIIVPSELATKYTGGGDHQGQYTRAQLGAEITGLDSDTGVPGGLTDVEGGSSDAIDVSIGIIGDDSVDATASDQVDALQDSIRPDAVMTNFLMTSGTDLNNQSNLFIQMYAVYFKLKVKPKSGYTQAQVNNAVRQYLASLFSWSSMRFARDINVSDVYYGLDGLASVDKVLFSNFSHYKNDETVGSLKIHDIEYKTKLADVSVTSEPLKAITSGNRITSVYVQDSFQAVAPNIIRRASGSWITDGFLNTDFVDITGFTTAVNNITNADIANVAATDLTLNTAVIQNEGPVSGVKVKVNTVGAAGALSFIDAGIAVGRRITITGFANNIISNILVIDVSADEIVLSSDEVTIVTELRKDCAINDNDERLENPLWNFADAESDRIIKIDILGLGGIDIEAY